MTEMVSYYMIIASVMIFIASIILPLIEDNDRKIKLQPPLEGSDFLVIGAISTVCGLLWPLVVILVLSTAISYVSYRLFG